MLTTNNVNCTVTVKLGAVSLTLGGTRRNTPGGTFIAKAVADAAAQHLLEAGIDSWDAIDVKAVCGDRTLEVKGHAGKASGIEALITGALEKAAPPKPKTHLPLTYASNAGNAVTPPPPGFEAHIEKLTEAVAPDPLDQAVAGDAPRPSIFKPKGKSKGR